MKNAKQYFDNHEAVDHLYFTSDGLAFFDKQNALNHADSLDDAAVTEMTRDEVYSELADITADLWEDDNSYDPLDEPDAE